MSERVNPPPQVSFPQRNPFKQGSQEWTFANQLIGALNSQRIVIEQLFRRTGGGDDAITEIQIGELYEPGIETVDNEQTDELGNELDMVHVIDFTERLEEIENRFDIDTDLSESIEDLENVFQIHSDFSERIEDIENKLDIGNDFTERLEELEVDLEVFSPQTVDLSRVEFEVVTIIASFTTTGNQIVICNNTSSITVTLNASAAEGELVHIKRANTGSVTVVSADNIDGTTSKTIALRYDSLHATRTYEIDEWSII